MQQIKESLGVCSTGNNIKCYNSKYKHPATIQKHCHCIPENVFIVFAFYLEGESMKVVK